MSKISVTGPKKHLDDVIGELHDLELLDIDQYDGELDTGEPSEEAEQLSELLVDVRSLISKMPEIEVEKETTTIDSIQRNYSDISEEVDELQREEEELKRKKENLKEEKKFFKKLKGSGLTYRDLQGTKTLDVWVGRLNVEEFEENILTDLYEVFEGESASAVIYSSKESDQIERAISGAAKEQYRVPESNVENGKRITQIINQIEGRKEQLENKLEQLENDRENLADKWLGKLEYIEEFLTEKVEKAEAPLRFATTEHAFIAQGWIPSDKFEKLEERLAQVSEGKIHIQEEEISEGEEPPVKHENNRAVQPFESLTDLVSVPKYNELDPSAMILLTFPLFFGLMIGDAGYGITTALVFYGGMKLFPKAKQIFKALLWTSVSTLFFGLLYGEMFGFRIYESPFYRANWWTEIFYLTIGIGVAHVNLGLLLGAYNEYKQHGAMEAVYAKLSWIFLEIAAVAGYLTATTYGTTPGAIVGVGIAAPSLIMMYMGEGVEAIVEIPSLISNILSYLRLFGVSMAAYTLAGTVNAIADPMYASGSILGLAGGTVIMIIGHALLTFLKIMEGFLQGIRLHYVEMFSWFFEGGGKKYAPFGAKQN